MKYKKAMFFLLVVLTAIAVQSCSVKRDCRGHLKHKLPNGIWI